MGEGIVVVTGASGYIGSHIVANLLSKGMHVRATVRDKNDPERVDHLKSMEIADGGSIEIVVKVTNSMPLQTFTFLLFPRSFGTLGMFILFRY